MIKKKKPEVNTGGNGHNQDTAAILAAFAELKQANERAFADVSQRMDDIEHKKTVDTARLLIADRMYNTPRDIKRELTVLPLRSVRSLAAADTVSSIMTPEVQMGKITLGQVWRDSHYSHMRSVKGLFVNMAKDLAMEEKRQEENPDLGEESALGKGL